MEEDKSQRLEFYCPICTEEGRSTKVVYNPDDPMFQVTGAFRRNRGAIPTIVYLTCDKGHTHRYRLKKDE